MKTHTLTLTAVALATMLLSARPADDTLTRQTDGTYVVNTTTLAPDVEGYVEATPLCIYIKDDKIQRIEALPNQETPKYFHKVKQGMLTQWNGKKVKTVLRDMKAEADGVTGATYSSNAVFENVKRGLQYYLKHKK
ncbi:MAG: FMN-binding protein [Bacteroidaceae bacterium]|nr:FMN-binding protein [Bacteroidaceae bacterium]